LPLLSILIFCGGNSKKEWAARAEGGTSFSRFQEKEVGGIHMQSDASPYKILQGTARRKTYMCLPRPPVRTHHPRRFEETV